jgi:hypothetical protein
VCHTCEDLVLFSEIEDHEEWCKKIKCASKTCRSILEYRSRKEFKINDEKTIQVCDNICYEMYQLQQAMKTQDPTTVLAFVDEFFSQHEENSGAAAAAEDKVRRESQQNSRL